MNTTQKQTQLKNKTGLVGKKLRTPHAQLEDAYDAVEQLEPIIGNVATEKAPPTVEELKLQLEFFTHMKYCAEARKARVEDLMQRRSANGWRTLKGSNASGWDLAKKTKMVRRLMRAGQEIEQASNAIDQLKDQLTKIEEGRHVGAVAPFVPPPATSV